jgi:hypothetical protein
MPVHGLLELLKAGDGVLEPFLNDGLADAWASRACDEGSLSNSSIRRRYVPDHSSTEGLGKDQGGHVLRRRMPHEPREITGGGKGVDDGRGSSIRVRKPWSGLIGAGDSCVLVRRSVSYADAGSDGLRLPAGKAERRCAQLGTPWALDRVELGPVWAEFRMFSGVPSVCRGGNAVRVPLRARFFLFRGL